MVFGVGVRGTGARFVILQCVDSNADSKFSRSSGRAGGRSSRRLIIALYSSPRSVAGATSNDQWL